VAQLKTSALRAHGATVAAVAVLTRSKVSGGVDAVGVRAQRDQDPETAPCDPVWARFGSGSRCRFGRQRRNGRQPGVAYRHNTELRQQPAPCRVRVGMRWPGQSHRRSARLHRRGESKRVTSCLLQKVARSGPRRGGDQRLHHADDLGRPFS
jgi:hypothetical protein